jgi:hypothetical protein
MSDSPKHGQHRFTPLDNGDVLLETQHDTIRIPKHHWCSIIATMSYYGEEDYGWYRAAQFHYGAPIDPVTCPLIDKPAPVLWRDQP